MTNDFVGKGEKTTALILQKLFDHYVKTQVPISSLIDTSDLSTHHSQHKIDIYIPSLHLAVELDLNHGDVSNQKMDIYRMSLKHTGYHMVNIIDDTRHPRQTRHIFESDPENITWDDFRDVIDALEKEGIKP